MPKMMRKIAFASAFSDLFSPYRYKIFYGGRGAAKSWHFAIALIILSTQKKIRILCAREYQSSISESVHKLLVDTIYRMNLENFFIIRERKILCTNGSEFLFHGLHHDINKIKSLENIDICWVEEAHSVTRNSWEVLIPTIRSEKSEIWISFNPYLEKDETYQRFIKNKQEDSLIKKVSFRDNPWFTKVLYKEMINCKKNDYNAYLNIWEGECLAHTNAQIFKDKYEVKEFKTPLNIKFYHGVDWGFSNDPTVLIRAFILSNHLYIDQEVYANNIDIDNIPQLFDSIETSRKSEIRADNSRPETINYLKRQGFNILAASKWAGSVIDGISILKSFEKIIIHPRCKNTIYEAMNYSYKVDKNTSEILPIILDKDNHCFDALRYALDTYIRGKNSMKFKR